MAWWARARRGAEPDGASRERQRRCSRRSGRPRVAGADLARAAAPGGARPRAARAPRRAPRTRARGRRRAAARSRDADRRPGGRARRDRGGASRRAIRRRLLLHGVTGSGKTEVYLRAAAAALAAGARRDRARARDRADAADRLALRRPLRRHRRGPALQALGRASATTSGTRLRAGEARVCVGPRSAVFAPIDRPRARSSSTRSTTPPTSTRATRATTPAASPASARGRPRRRAARRQRDAATRERPRRCARLRLPARVDGQSLPAVEIVDMRGADGALHPRTRARAGRRAQGDRPAQPPRLVELPRLPRLRPRLEVPAVRRRRSSCTARGGRWPATTAATASACPSACSECGSVSVARHGTGTERLEHDLAALGHEVLPPRRRRRRSGAVLRGVRARRARGARRHADGRQGPRLPRRRRSASSSTPTRRCASPTSAPRSARSRSSPSSPAAPGAAPKAAGCSCRRWRPTRASIAAAARHDADGFLAGELAPPRGAALPAVLDADPGRLLAPRSPARAIAGGDARSRGRVERATVLGPAPLFRLRGRERAQVVVKAPTRAGRGRASVGAAVDARAAAHRASRLSVDVDPQ